MPADDEMKAIWTDHAAGRLTDDEAQAAAEAVDRRRSGQGRTTGPSDQPMPASARRKPGAKRPKVFGYTYGRAIDRNARVRLMHRARCFMRRTEPGRAYGELTAKHVQVLEALLGFLNWKDGRCFPSLAKLAERAGCAISTAQLAIAALERVGLLSWVHRLKRVWIDGRTRVHRTSNGYAFGCDTETRRRTRDSRAIPSLAAFVAAEPERAFEGAKGRQDIVSWDRSRARN